MLLVCNKAGKEDMSGISKDIFENITHCGCHCRKLGLVARQPVTDEVSSFSNLVILEKHL